MAILLSNANFGMPSGERRRFQLIFCHRLDREMDFVLIPFIHPALILFYTPLGYPLKAGQWGVGHVR
jgi:hypothetical protein